MYEKHYEFSENYPIELLKPEELLVFNHLNQLKEKLNFPAIRNDIGSFFNSILANKKDAVIFEFGSGYGHSAFWYFLNQNSIKKVYLTEKRTDLLTVFNEVPFDAKWKEKLEYFQGDAFDFLESQSGFDFVLIDGQKSDYTKFLHSVLSKMNSKGIIAVDNAFWKGSVINEGNTSDSSAKAIRQHHEAIKEIAKKHSLRLNYFPFRDGLLVLELN